ncbi:MAG: DNA primase [Leadbetterella sp.]|nr:DNA primase [Leadbetterella sp.]
MIPQDTVNQILQAAEISEVVGEFVNLKKRGANLIACCPFHNEKTPSFSVSPAKGIYKCFGCGKGGDSVRFIMDLEGFSYPDALKWLAKKYNIEVKEKEFTDTELAAQNERESLFIVSEFAEKYFRDILLNTEEGQSIGGSYFRERGFSQPMLERFHLGYAPDGRDDFYRAATGAGFSAEVLDKAGLISVKDNQVFLDRFRGRVIFPIHNVAGKPIAFGARILKTDARAPKYVNSPETDIYHKSHIVYGIYQAKNAIRQKENCFLVEGYTDVISLHQAGIENVVASSGTSLTVEQIRLIGRFTDNITVLYDGDTAGIKASLRGIDLILEEGLNVKAVVFPQGDDPDSFIRKVGGEAFSRYVEQSQKDFISFKTEISLADIGNDAVKKAELIESLVLSITKVPNPVKRQIFYQEVGRLLNMDEHILITEGNKLLGVQARSTVQKNDGGKVTPLPPQRNLEMEVLSKADTPQEEALVKDLVLFGQTQIGEDYPLANYIFNETGPEMIADPVLQAIYKQYREFWSRGEAPPDRYFVSHPDPRIQEVVIDWESPKHTLSRHWKKYEIFVPDYQDFLAEIITRINFRIALIRVRKEILEIIEQLDTEDEDREIILQEALDKKNREKKEIAEFLGSVL